MTLEEIKAAVREGKKVHWCNDGYEVKLSTFPPMRSDVQPEEQWLIVFTPNGHAIGLTWTDGVTMNGKPEEFYYERDDRQPH